MDKKRNIIIDTDTASDDAVAIIMALRDPSVNVLGITCVAGNLYVDQCVRNALISIDYAGTYAPPVYRGMEKPMIREKMVTAHATHGQDGLGDVGYPDPKGKPQPEHAVDALARMVTESEGDDREIVTLGPVSNVAMAILKAPEAFKKVKMITMMGSAGLGPGNCTPVAEFNIWADAEAAQIVMQSGVPFTVVGWDACLGKAILTVEEIDALMADNPSELVKFCIECNRCLRNLNVKRFGSALIDFADPVAMAVAIHPECVAKMIDAYCFTEYKSESTYGQVVIDYDGVAGKPFNGRVCTELDADEFKRYLYSLIKG